MIGKSAGFKFSFSKSTFLLFQFSIFLFCDSSLRRIRGFPVPRSFPASRLLCRIRDFSVPGGTIFSLNCHNSITAKKQSAECDICSESSLCSGAVPCPIRQIAAHIFFFLITMTTFPFISFSFTGPKSRLSFASLRRSPRTKNASCGTFTGYCTLLRAYVS